VPGGGVGDADDERLPRCGGKGEMEMLVTEAEWAW